MNLKAHLVGIMATIALIFFAGCASTPKPTVINVAVNAQPNVNPDSFGRASPIVVKLYELKSEAAFNAADFFSLIDGEQKTLGSELINTEVFQLRPGESLKLERPVQPDTRYIAVVAAFRDLEHSQWRATLPIPEKKKIKRINVQLDTSKIMIRGQQKCFLWC
jgi:type VI secretion system protein VasD